MNNNDDDNGKGFADIIITTKPEVLIIFGERIGVQFQWPGMVLQSHIINSIYSKLKYLISSSRQKMKMLT